MLIKTNFIVSGHLMTDAVSSLPKIEDKLSLNKPNGNFFYDPWSIKAQYKNTVWESILGVLPNNIGEARIILLGPKSAYTAHADIDDRYHLNLLGENSYLLDLDDKRIHPTVSDGIWYEMDAGKLHSATNLGGIDRIQLVVRKLLTQNKLSDPTRIIVSAIKKFDENNRYIFDQTVSKWLNKANKENKINNFQYIDENEVSLDIETSELKTFYSILPKEFKIIV